MFRRVSPNWQGSGLEIRRVNNPWGFESLTLRLFRASPNEIGASRGTDENEITEAMSGQSLGSKLALVGVSLDCARDERIPHPPLVSASFLGFEIE